MPSNTYMLRVNPEVKDRVLRTIRTSSPRPTELLQGLQAELTYRDIQDALLELLENGDIDLGSDRRLREVPPVR